jgi:hypothetical protein
MNFEIYRTKYIDGPHPLTRLRIWVGAIQRTDLDAIRADADTVGRDFYTYIAAVALDIDYNEVMPQERAAVKDGLFLLHVRGLP